MLWAPGKEWHQEILEIKDDTVQVQKAHTPPGGELRIYRYMSNGRRSAGGRYEVFTDLEEG